jgi:hypothetical protein
MRTLTLLSFLISIVYADAQDNLHSNIENGKFYGIFPVAENYIAYIDTLVLTGPVNKDSLYDKAKAFFDQKEDAKYYLESEDRDAGELVYQGELNKSIMSDKSDVHFSVVLHFSDTICSIRLSDIVMASSKAQYSPAMSNMNGGMTTTGSVKTGVKETAMQIENITIDKSEFSRKYCEKINSRFLTIMSGLKTTFEINSTSVSQ